MKHDPSLLQVGICSRAQDGGICSISTVQLDPKIEAALLSQAFQAQVWLQCFVRLNISWVLWLNMLGGVYFNKDSLKYWTIHALYHMLQTASFFFFVGSLNSCSRYCANELCIDHGRRENHCPIFREWDLLSLQHFSFLFVGQNIIRVAHWSQYLGICCHMMWGQ